jgi:hypothetical protein
MVALVVLPELLAMGTSFRIGTGLVAHLHEPPGDPSAIRVSLDVEPGGEYDFLYQWAEKDPAALEDWGRELVLSLNRMAAEGMAQVEIPMPQPVMER